MSDARARLNCSTTSPSASTIWCARAFYDAALASPGIVCMCGEGDASAGYGDGERADYYGAFVLDPDGHNIEAVCHQPLR
ncbi:hypothetical protein [Acidisoma sp.]|uniref:hypothetical protein n=1 Tax=Acidisoma sp. TaxID=1872115 RepID=UPI003AFFD33E